MKKQKFVNVLIAATLALCLGLAAVGCTDGTLDGPGGVLAPTTYTVTYTVDSGVTGTAPTEANKKAGDKFTVASAEGLSKTGYTFAAWNDGSKDYAAGAEYTMPAAAVTFTAKWTKNNDGPIEETTYTVTYTVESDVTGTVPTEANKKAGDKFTVASAEGLTKTGYTFAAWNDGSKDYAAGEEYTMPAAAVTFTAKWTEDTVTPVTKYTVTFDPRNEEEEWTVEVAEGGTVQKPVTDPVHPQGKAFQYWTNSSVEYDFTNAVTGDITLTASYAWKVTFVIGEGATGSVDPIFVNMWTMRGIELPSGSGLSNGDKVFGGWTDGTDNYKAGDIYVGTGNETLTAIWNDASVTPPPPVGEKHTVTVLKASREDYIANISGDAPIVADKAAGEQFTVDVSGLSYAHYRITRLIIKHYVVENGSGEWVELTRVEVGGSITMPDENIQVAPVWSVSSVTVSFDANGGSGTMADIQRDYNSNYSTVTSVFQCKFTPPTASQEFLGWATTPTGAVLTNGTKLAEPIVSAQDTITLYAIWSAAQTTPTVTIESYVGHWTDGTNTFDIVAEHPTNAHADGAGILNGKYYMDVFVSDGSISSVNGNEYYLIELDGSSLVLLGNDDEITFTTKTAITDNGSADFIGKWTRSGVSQHWIITADKAFMYRGGTLYEEKAHVINGNIALIYSVGDYNYYFVVSKSGSALTGIFSAPEKDDAAVTLNAGEFILLTVDGTPNQVVASGAAPDATLIKVPTAPEGKEFSKWVIAGTETEFDVTATMTADVSIEPLWADAESSAIVFVGNCTTPVKAFLGGETYVSFAIDTKNRTVVYKLSNGTEKTVTYTDNSSSQWKPDKYESDALYIEVTMEAAYYILINKAQTKLWLCDSDDNPLSSGEFYVQTSDEWVSFSIAEGSDFYAKAEAATSFYFAEYANVSNTDFIGIQFFKNSLGVCLKTIYISNGAEKVLTSTIAYQSVSTENGCWLVFTSSSYTIVLGQKNDGKYYVLSLTYKSVTDSTVRELLTEKPVQA